MFTANDVTIGNGSKYQSAGVNERVTITEVKLIKNEQYGTSALQFKTLNENSQEGLSKRLSLTTEVKPGKSTSGWKVSAKYLLNILMSTGKSFEEAQKVLEAGSESELIKNLENALIGKTFRGLFSSREYQTNKFAIELYITEPVGGTRLVWDPTNKFYNSKLDTEPVGGDGLPF